MRPCRVFATDYGLCRPTGAVFVLYEPACTKERKADIFLWREIAEDAVDLFTFICELVLVLPLLYLLTVIYVREVLVLWGYQDKWIEAISINTRTSKVVSEKLLYFSKETSLNNGLYVRIRYASHIQMTFNHQFHIWTWTIFVMKFICSKVYVYEFT